MALLLFMDLIFMPMDKTWTLMRGRRLKITPAHKKSKWEKIRRGSLFLFFSFLFLFFFLLLLLNKYNGVWRGIVCFCFYLCIVFSPSVILTCSNFFFSLATLSLVQTHPLQLLPLYRKLARPYCISVERHWLWISKYWLGSWRPGKLKKKSLICHRSLSPFLFII